MPKTLPLIKQALNLSEMAHKGQIRASGEPYIEHPKAVAELLKQALHADTETIAAALLHDVMEDTPITGSKIQKQFGPTVRRLVEGVTKISKIEQDLPSHERNMQSIRKMFRVMGKDLRVIFIKLADRLHNLRTIEHLRRDKQIRIAKETLEIYCPLVNLLGIRSWYKELSDRSFAILEPAASEALQQKMFEADKNYKKKLLQWMQTIQSFFSVSGMKKIEAELRTRHLQNIYETTLEQKALLENIETFYRIYLLTENEDDCYRVLGNIHKVTASVPHQIHDYIAHPKVNGYRALHVTVLSPWGNPILVIIQTKQMDREAQYGAALPYQEKRMKKEQWKELPEWIDMLMQLEHREENLSQFFHALQTEIFGERSRLYFISGKKQKYLDLPSNATMLDAAYHVSPKKAKFASGVQVNSERSSLKRIIHDGDTVELLLNKHFHRSPLDIFFLNTSFAQNALIEDLSSLPKKDIVRNGEQVLLQTVDILIDPFFPMAWRKSMEKTILKKKTGIVNVGSGSLNPFTYIEELSSISDFFLLNPRCFHFSSRLAPHENVRFILRTSLEHLQTGNIIGRQVRPDVIEIESVNPGRQGGATQGLELVSLNVNKKEVNLQPFVASLQWKFRKDSNPLKIIATLQNQVDTPLELVEFHDTTVTLNFFTNNLHTFSDAYQYLHSQESVESIYRTSP